MGHPIWWWSRHNPTSKATDRSVRPTRVRIACGEQQVPHRAWRPVRNDIPISHPQYPSAAEALLTLVAVLRRGLKPRPFKTPYGTTEVVPLPVEVSSKSHGVDVCGIPLLAKDARNGAPYLVVVLRKPQVQKRRTGVFVPHEQSQSPRPVSAKKPRRQGRGSRNLSAWRDSRFLTGLGAR